MIQTVEEYLSLLKKQLAGCDRATIQDALSDAEEHLRTALEGETSDTNVSEVEALSRIIEKYGSPEEIATAYREIENKISPALEPVKPQPETGESGKVERDERSALRRFFSVFNDPVTWGSFLYMFISLATGILYFTWVVTGISLSAGLIVLIIGLPFTALFILSVRGLGLVEGRIVEALLGVRMPRRQPYSPKSQGWIQRFKDMFSDTQTWSTIIYMILQMPLGIIYFTVFITLISLSLSGITIPILQYGYDIPVIWINNTGYFLDGWVIPFIFAGCVLLGFATMHLARYIGRMHGAMAKAMLVRV